jgi:hypothetical protein
MVYYEVKIRPNRNKSFLDRLASSLLPKRPAYAFAQSPIDRVTISDKAKLGTVSFFLTEDDGTGPTKGSAKKSDGLPQIDKEALKKKIKEKMLVEMTEEIKAKLLKEIQEELTMEEPKLREEAMKEALKEINEEVEGTRHEKAKKPVIKPVIKERPVVSPKPAVAAPSKKPEIKREEKKLTAAETKKLLENGEFAKVLDLAGKKLVDLNALSDGQIEKLVQEGIEKCPISIVMNFDKIPRVKDNIRRSAAAQIANKDLNMFLNNFGKFGISDLKDLEKIFLWLLKKHPEDLKPKVTSILTCISGKVNIDRGLVARFESKISLSIPNLIKYFHERSKMKRMANMFIELAKLDPEAALMNFGLSNLYSWKMRVRVVNTIAGMSGLAVARLFQHTGLGINYEEKNKKLLNEQVDDVTEIFLTAYANNNEVKALSNNFKLMPETFNDQQKAKLIFIEKSWERERKKKESDLKKKKEEEAKK